MLADSTSLELANIAGRYRDAVRQSCQGDAPARSLGNLRLRMLAGELRTFWHDELGLLVAGLTGESDAAEDQCVDAATVAAVADVLSVVAKSLHANRSDVAESLARYCDSMDADK